MASSDDLKSSLDAIAGIFKNSEGEDRMDSLISAIGEVKTVLDQIKTGQDETVAKLNAIKDNLEFTQENQKFSLAKTIGQALLKKEGRSVFERFDRFFSFTYQYKNEKGKDQQFEYENTASIFADISLLLTELTLSTKAFSKMWINQNFGSSPPSGEEEVVVEETDNNQQGE